MAISRAQLLKELLPGLNALFGLEYARYGEEHKEIYETETSERSFEEETKLSGFSAAPVKNEGQAMAYDNAQEAWSARYNHETIALGFSLTEEAIEDNLYDSLSGRYTKALARAMAYTKQVKAANVINNGFTSGYTGGDGYEISTPADRTDEIARKLLAMPEVKPIGLGARDSLRLEAGLCLYGHDIDTATTPIEAGLLWSIGKERRAQGGFPGASVIQQQIKDGAPRKRVGLLPEGKAIAREGAEIVIAGRQVGKVTSGGFAPSLNGPVAMGYVEKAQAQMGTKVQLIVRGKALADVLAAHLQREHEHGGGRGAGFFRQCDCLREIEREGGFPH